MKSRRGIDIADMGTAYRTQMAMRQSVEDHIHGDNEAFAEADAAGGAPAHNKLPHHPNPHLPRAHGTRGPRNIHHRMDQGHSPKVVHETIANAGTALKRAARQGPMAIVRVLEVYLQDAQEM